MLEFLLIHSTIALATNVVSKKNCSGNRWSNYFFALDFNQFPKKSEHRVIIIDSDNIWSEKESRDSTAVEIKMRSSIPAPSMNRLHEINGCAGSRAV